MIAIEYVVAPEVLENREFQFTPYQEMTIAHAKKLGKMLRGEFINFEGRTMIWRLNIVQ